jgi:NCS1 family nucleobase:cation symporter-1
MHVPSLYNVTPGSPYMYTHGFNLRAYAAWIIAIALVISGIAGVLQPGSIGTAAVRIYNLGFLLSTSVAALVYYASCKIWPVQLYPTEYTSSIAPKDTSWEVMRYTEGFFPEDEVIPEYVRDEMLMMGVGLEKEEVQETVKIDSDVDDRKTLP